MQRTARFKEPARLGVDQLRHGAAGQRGGTALDLIGADAPDGAVCPGSTSVLSGVTATWAESAASASVTRYSVGSADRISTTPLNPAKPSRVTLTRYLPNGRRLAVAIPAASVSSRCRTWFTSLSRTTGPGTASPAGSVTTTRSSPLSGRANWLRATRSARTARVMGVIYDDIPAGASGSGICKRRATTRLTGVSERAAASEPRERSAPAQRRARERVGESEGRSPSNKTRGGAHGNDFCGDPPPTVTTGGCSSAVRYPNRSRNSSRPRCAVAASFAMSCGSSKSSRFSRIM
jgi:hypothetical protein